MWQHITGYIKVLLVVAMSTVHSHLNHMPIYSICLSTVDDAMTVVASMLHVMTERHLTQIRSQSTGTQHGYVSKGPKIRTSSWFFSG